MATKQVTLLSDVLGNDGRITKEGKTVELDEKQANHLIFLGAAKNVVEDKDDEDDLTEEERIARDNQVS